MDVKAFIDLNPGPFQEKAPPPVQQKAKRKRVVEILDDDEGDNPNPASK